MSDLLTSGVCVCNGYADNCTVDSDSGLYQCELYMRVSLLCIVYEGLVCYIYCI